MWGAGRPTMVLDTFDPPGQFESVLGAIGTLRRRAAGDIGRGDDPVSSGETTRRSVAWMTHALRLGQHGIGEARPRLLRPLAERFVREARERQARVGVDPEERAAAAEVAERPGRVARARPVR